MADHSASESAISRGQDSAASTMASNWILELGGPYRIRPMPTDIARYSIELFKPGGEGAGIEEILDRHADLKIARSIYRTRVEEILVG